MFTSGSIANRWSTWLATPFASDVNLSDWIVITLLAATISFGWTLLLHDLVDREIV